MYSSARSCSVTVKPRSAAPGGDVPAHDPGADDVHVAQLLAALPPWAFRRSCSRNTRTRLREVASRNRCAIERASASKAAGPCAP